MTRRHLVVVLIGSLGLLLLAHSAGATAQCPGRINACGTDCASQRAKVLGHGVWTGSGWRDCRHAVEQPSRLIVISGSRSKGHCID